MKILFQGDSITDAYRSFDWDENVGIGYPLLVKASLGFEMANEHKFINRGISGNRVTDIYARIKNDILNLKPDVISILIGVNDVWHDLAEKPNGVDSEKYYKIYDMLICEIKEALPDVKIMIMEPFVLKGNETEEKWDVFRAEVEKRSEKAKAISEKYNWPFIELQKGFDELAKKAEPSYWLADGVHPTAMGHEFIKNEWIKMFKSL